MTFFKEAEDMPAYAMVQMVDTSMRPVRDLIDRRRRGSTRAINARARGGKVRRPGAAAHPGRAPLAA